MAFPVGNSLRYIHQGPKFNGEPSEIKSFFNYIDRLEPVVTEYTPIEKRLISGAILTKIEGKAKTILENNPDVGRNKRIVGAAFL